MSDEQAILAVNAAYYLAFASADPKAIEQLWAPEGVTCVHPGWRPLVGRRGVVKSYRDILANARPVPITCSDESVIVTGDFARVICTERVGRVLLAATNCFVRTPQGWLMAHHQASQVAEAVPARPARADAVPRTLN
ncbi:MAG: nuclear transport factor 2 family protein [Beijerinckiaceae bacterium]|nr:nuclear transport factor 2 family protein [Beijerinckiaceae bacterium]